MSAGEFFLDLIFFDLPRLPALGEELKTDNFDISFGGGAAITALTSARLGGPCELMTVWGDSPLDAQSRDRLEKAGVSCSHCLTAAGERSGLAVAVSTREDRYFLTCPGANRHVESYLLDPDAWLGADAGTHVHLALTPADWLPFQTLVERLQDQGATVSWDLGWDPDAMNSPGYPEIVHQVDLLFMNDKEACFHTGSATVDEALAALAGERTVVIKAGSRGAVASGPDREALSAPAISVDAVDSVGAGDAFNGGFLHGWLQGWDLQSSLSAGNICGGLSTRVAGGTGSLPDRREFDTLIGKNGKSTS